MLRSCQPWLCQDSQPLHRLFSGSAAECDVGSEIRPIHHPDSKLGEATPQKARKKEKERDNIRRGPRTPNAPLTPPPPPQTKSNKQEVGGAAWPKSLRLAAACLFAQCACSRRWSSLVLLRTSPRWMSATQTPPQPEVSCGKTWLWVKILYPW